MFVVTQYLALLNHCCLAVAPQSMRFCSQEAFVGISFLMKVTDLSQLAAIYAVSCRIC